jgi:uncharacterized FlgJ-related protein
MARKRATYRIVLRNKRGGFSSIRYAVSFELLRGSRRLLKQEFSEKIRTTSKKKAFLALLIETYEVERLKVLRKKSKKLQQELRRLKKIHSEAGPIVQTRIAEDDKTKLEIERQKKLALKEYPDFSRPRNVNDTLVIPFRPRRSEYEKLLVEKLVYSKVGSSEHELYLTILDLKFLKDFVEMTRYNFKESAREAYSRMIPHALIFFNHIHNISPSFILRITFLRNINDKWFNHGVSLSRREIADAKQLRKIFLNTFHRLLLGADGRIDGAKSYLIGEDPIFITGFTLEATKTPRTTYVSRTNPTRRK